MIKSNLISLLIHTLIVIILIFFGKTNTISPAMPQGVEISIIEENHIEQNIEPVVTPKENITIKTQKIQTKSKKQIKNKAQKKQIKKGNQNSLNKEGNSEAKSIITNYANLVSNLIKPYINIPLSINKQAIAVVEVTIFPNMDVYSIKLLKSSGNDTYDQNVKNAILKVKTFPPIPPNTRWVDFRVLVLTFKPI